VTPSPDAGGTETNCTSVVYDKNFKGPVEGFPKDSAFDVHCITKVFKKQISVKMKKNDNGSESYSVSETTIELYARNVQAVADLATNGAYAAQNHNYNMFAVPNFAKVAKANGFTYGIDRIEQVSINMNSI
jgi:hypothetical protein